MKLDKHFAGAAAIVLFAIGLITLTWAVTLRAINAERTENIARVTATVSNQALTFSEQISRQLLALDQTLRIMENAWETNPQQFDLEAWRAKTPALTGLGQDLILADGHGIVRQSTVTEAINQDISGVDFFQALSRNLVPYDHMFVGTATIGQIMRTWHMNVARALHAQDGSFAGVLDAEYRVSAITDVFSQTDLGTGSFITLIGLNDGKLRAAVGPASIDPDASIVDTSMFKAISRSPAGVWIGPSATDAVLRIHAFRRIPDRDLMIVVAMDEVEALAPSTEWQAEADVFASCITILMLGLTFVVVRGTVLARRREAAVAEDRAILASANAQSEVARALADAKAEQLQATLAGMTDGVAMVDAHLCLAEWNNLFPEIAGVPAEILRVGLPMEDILRAQIQTGQFGYIPDADAEIARRVARLRQAQFGVGERQRPDGRTIELRRKRLPDGGFVTLYADITDRKHAEEALRSAQAEAEAANAAKSRFVAIVSHEIRTPLNALLNSVRLLSDSALTPIQQSLLTMARQSGDVLFGLINDILDMSQIEAGKLSIRPSLFNLRLVLESCLEMFEGQAEEKGISMRLEIAPDVPELLLTDPGRLRQVLLNLISNAVKYARRGIVTLSAEPGEDAAVSVCLLVKDPGPAIEEAARQRLFRPFSRLDRPGDVATTGTGLGLAICRELMTLMGGDISHETWVDEAGQEGNLFRVTLPLSALPHRDEPAGTDDLAPDAAVGRENDRRETTNSETTGHETTGREITGRETSGHETTGLIQPQYQQVPRSRVLIVEDVTANQLVTATLLRRAGHCVDIASSGNEAIEMVKARPFDLVFMDIFMPGMGGQETTQILRTLPSPSGTVPVIALTAQVSTGDEASFMACGMDGILGKPVSLTEMLDTLREHVWSKRQDVSAVEQAVDAGVPDISSSLSAERIDELKTSLPPERLAELVEECLMDLDHRMPALRRALAAGVPGAITAHAHTMAGVAAAYGMVTMEAKLRRTMDAVRDGRPTAFDEDTIVEIEVELARSSRLLRNIAQAANDGARR
jgi:signal transduction histidine kinase/DNA-binding response OmpR family regulator